MNNKNVAKLINIIVLSLMLSLPLMAQERASVGRQVTRQINGQTVTIDVPPENAPTETNFNRYKSDLLSILTAQKAILGTMGVTNPEISGKVDSALQQVQALNFSELGENYPGFPDLTALKRAVVGQESLMAQAYVGGKGKILKFTPGDAFPEDVYASYCPLNPQAPEIGYTSGFVLLAAEIVRDIAEDFCNQITSILGVGGNFRIACIITDVIYFTAKFIDYPIQACDTDSYVVAPTATIFNRLSYIHDQLDYSIANDNTNKALLSTQLTNAESQIVTNENNNKASLSSQINTFQTLNTRIAIEANLAEDPATLSATGLFETPASQGGYLEIARQILIDTYNAHLAAAGPGVTIYNPSAELSIGASFTAQGKYREAYYYYRRGYRSVVKYP